MNSKKLSESILKKIQKENILPTGRWYFILKNIAFWGIFNLSVLLGAIGISIIIFAIFETDFDLFSYLKGTELQFWLSMLPIFWILFFITFTGIAIWGMQHTRKGYRLSIIRMLGLNLLLSILLGILFYNIGGAEKFESIFEKNIPLYKGIHTQRSLRWTHPEEGKLAGKIISLQKNKILMLSSFDKSEWAVDYSESMILTPFDLTEGLRIRVMGLQTGKKNFKAEMIDLWRPPREMRRMPFFPREEGEIRFPPHEKRPPIEDIIKTILEK